MDKTNTYELTTSKGYFIAGMSAFIPIALILYGMYDANKSAWTPLNMALVVGGVVIFLGYVGLAWINTVASELNEREAERRKAMAITSETEMAKLELDRLHQVRILVNDIHRLSNDHLSFAARLIEGELFRLDERGITWYIDGKPLSLAFAKMWLDEYENRQKEDTVLLPANSDFDKYPNRDLLREYNRIVIGALAKLGKAIQAESRYPARWAVQSEKERNAALWTIGVPQAEALYKWQAEFRTHAQN